VNSGPPDYAVALGDARGALGSEPRDFARHGSFADPKKLGDPASCNAVPYAPENVAMLAAGALEEAKLDADPARDRARLRDLQTQKLNMVQALKLAPNVAELAVELRRVQEEEDTVRARMQAARARYDEERLEGVLLAQVRQLRSCSKARRTRRARCCACCWATTACACAPTPSAAFAVEGLAA
jgi:hypothetical protein